jgi:hypothetical protein
VIRRSLDHGGGGGAPGGNFDRKSMAAVSRCAMNGAIWTEAVKPLGSIGYIVKARIMRLRDPGPATLPFNALTFLQGLETLPLRTRRARRCVVTRLQRCAFERRVGRFDRLWAEGRKGCTSPFH